MMEWDCRMQNTHSMQVLKTAIPFFDVSVGERIDLEGLLGAIRPLTSGREKKIIDLFLQFFQMRRMMEMMQVMQSVQQAQEMSGEKGTDSFDLLRAMVPPDKQETFDMMSSMMAMMQSEPEPPQEQEEENGGKGEDESVDF